MCRKLQVHGFKPANSFYFTFSFSLVYKMWLHGLKPAKSLLSPFFCFSFLCMLKLLHVHCIWVDSTFSLFGPCILTRRFPLWLWIVAVNHLAAPSWYSHSISCHSLTLGVQPGDQMRLARHASIKHMWPWCVHESIAAFLSCLASFV